jgi:hypothetical protein
MLAAMKISREQWDRAAEWTGLYAANLVIPLLIGRVATAYGGGLGMLSAVVAVWAAGLVVCARTVRLSGILFYGAGVVALCQMVPVLQIVAGYFALRAWSAVGGALDEGGVKSEVGGFAVTLMTAQPLLLAAFVFGGGHRLLVEWRGDDD